MAVVSMSKQEFSRLEVLLRVQSGRLRIADACELIGLQRRQVFRLLRGLKQDGATSLLSKRRGKPSNNRLPPEVRTLALSIVRDRYADFGPTLAAEKLAEHHGCSVSRETLRSWMITDGLWRDRRPQDRFARAFGGGPRLARTSLDRDCARRPTKLGRDGETTPHSNKETAICNTANRRGTRPAVSLIRSASNGGVISTLRAG